MAIVVGKDSSVAKRITCKNCGAINEYHLYEVRELYSGRDISGASEGRYGFNCAGCCREITTRSW